MTFKNGGIYVIRKVGHLSESLSTCQFRQEPDFFHRNHFFAW